MIDLTQTELRRRYFYNPETGVFIRLLPTRGKAKQGCPAGFRDRNGHVRIGFGAIALAAHRLAWLYTRGHWPEGDIDHINGVRSDNRLSNLRDVSRLLNQQNQRVAHKDSKTRLLGVTFSKKCQKFQAQISINKKMTYLGLFDTGEAAHAAYLAAKRQHHAGGTI